MLKLRRLRWLILPAVLLPFFLFSLLWWWQNDPRNQWFLDWRNGTPATRTALLTVQRDRCGNAPFVLPADGFIGLLYNDPRPPYSSFAPHQGIDIFSETAAGVTPVYSAYDGYVTREAGWKSALIVRVPDDPLQPGRQIWLYYTHMADQTGNSFIVEQIPAGTSELFVPQGSLLGYTGDYNGNSGRSIWVHLHFSIVRDDGSGRFLNELDVNNTVDPTPYLGLTVNYEMAETIPRCQSEG